MDVTFRRTGERRYAVVVQVGDGPAQVMDPAPGFDAHVPHDLVHYVVEAELGLTRRRVRARSAWWGTFIAVGSTGQKARDQARARRKQRRREASLRHVDEEAAGRYGDVGTTRGRQRPVLEASSGSGSGCFAAGAGLRALGEKTPNVSTESLHVWSSSPHCGTSCPLAASSCSRGRVLC